MRVLNTLIRNAAMCLALAGVVGAHVPAWAGTTYRFTVSCPSGKQVAEWRTGTIDPGREYLVVVTGTKHPGCSVSPFNHETDSHLPVDTYSGAVGVVQGIPFLGIVVRKVLRF